MAQQFETLALYNRWANNRLIEDIKVLSATDLFFDAGCNFKSIMGILNHLLLADQAWLSRFTGQGPAPTSLDALPCPDFSALIQARRLEDERILTFARAVAGQGLDETFHYRDMKGRPSSGPFALLLLHFFNHQTHHRGQVHVLAGRFGLTPRDIDLVYFLKEPRA